MLNFAAADPVKSDWNNTVFLCRNGFENELSREIALRLNSGPGAAVPSANPPAQQGLVVLPGALSGLRAEKLARPLVFERQRLPEARFYPHAPVQQLARVVAGAVLPEIAQARPPWSVQVFAANPNAAKSLAGWARRLDGALRASLASPGSAPPGDFREDAHGLPPARGRVLQLCAVPGGVWVSLAAPGALSSPNPGGVHTMPADPLAPSRSYLKIEEALQLLGVAPAPREKVIDLGAAPGGWSYAFLKRGCRVLAVDNGPMKLKGVEALGGELTHLRANGLTFRPPPGWTPVDWLVSDMLVPPGPCVGLLRRWLQGGWARRFIVNIKLPQRMPLTALQPVEALLLEQRGLRYHLRQLYHDRREVTAMGLLEQSRPPRRGRAGRRGR